MSNWIKTEGKQLIVSGKMLDLMLVAFDSNVHSVSYEEPCGLGE